MSLASFKSSLSEFISEYGYITKEMYGEYIFRPLTNLLMRDIAKKISVGLYPFWIPPLEMEQFDKLVQFASENQDIIRTLSKY